MSDDPPPPTKQVRLRRPVASVLLLITGLALVGVLLGDLVMMPSLESFVARLRNLGPEFGTVVVIIFLGWALVSLILFGLAARTAARRESGVATRAAQAVRDALWMGTLTALTCLGPAVVAALMRDWQPPPEVNSELQRVFALALVLGVAATAVTFVASSVGRRDRLGSD